MKKSFALIALECFFDLGVTVIYATIAGLLIVGIVASDDGAPSLVATLLYASILPIAVVLLIAIDLALRVFAEWRETRRRAGGPRSFGGCRDAARLSTNRA